MLNIRLIFIKEWSIFTTDRVCVHNRESTTDLISVYNVHNRLIKSMKQSNFYLRPHTKALIKKEGSLEMSKRSQKRDFFTKKE